MKSFDAYIIRACPFCGQIPILTDGRRHPNGEWVEIPKVWCKPCGIVMHGQSREEALTKWDKRAGGQQPAMSETGGTKVVGFQRGVMPPIVCLCGSTRFVETFNDWRKRLTHEGKIVLSIEIVTSQARHEDPQHTNGELKVMLDELHLRKIDLATEVMVLNVGGYIGESTRREIEYATATGKPIRWLENPEA